MTPPEQAVCAGRLSLGSKARGAVDAATRHGAAPDGPAT